MKRLHRSLILAIALSLVPKAGLAQVLPYIQELTEEASAVIIGTVPDQSIVSIFNQAKTNIITPVRVIINEVLKSTDAQPQPGFEIIIEHRGGSIGDITESLEPYCPAGVDCRVPQLRPGERVFLFLIRTGVNYAMVGKGTILFDEGLQTDVVRRDEEAFVDREFTLARLRQQVFEALASSP